MLKFMQQDVAFIDLTHTLNSEIPQWEAECGFTKTVILDYAASTGGVKFCVQNLNMRAGIGTHMDAPSHCISGGSDIAAIPLEKLIAPCVVINISTKADECYQLGMQDIEQFEKQHGIISPGSFVIIYTGWDKYWEDIAQYRNELIFPSVAPEAASFLLARDIIGLGIDTLSPDTGNSDYPVHKILLGAGKYIVENVANASLLKPTGAIVFVLPIKIENGTEAPIRLIAMQTNQMG